jgi:hypothetical protein
MLLDYLTCTGHDCACHKWFTRRRPGTWLLAGHWRRTTHIHNNAIIQQDRHLRLHRHISSPRLIRRRDMSHTPEL